MQKILTLFFLGAVFLCVNVPAQESAGDALQTLPDHVMQQVVSRILKFHFGPASRPRSVLVSERGIKPEWLPAIPNINFQLASDNDALNAKNGALLFEDLRQDGDHYSINVGWGDYECRGYGNAWRFYVGKDHKVRLWLVKDSIWGRGCGGSEPPRIRGLSVGEVSPNEIPGFEFFKNGKLKTIRLGISTRDDMRRIFGDACESTCNYDDKWEINADYFDDRAAFTRSDGSGTVTEFLPRPEYVDKLMSIRLTPKRRVSFAKVSFPRTFWRSQGFAVGDDWDENGFAGAVHTNYTVYVDGYGLEYHVFGAETFNNLRDKSIREKDPLRKGDLNSIEYTIPESLEDVIHERKVKVRD